MTTPAYNIDYDIKYGFLKLIDVDRIRRETQDEWSNQTLCQVNDCVIRLGVVQGEFHWHKHEREDEYFHVVSGRLFVDIQDGPTFELLPNQGVNVPRGVVHRTRAPERTAMLMIEAATVKAVGDD